MKILHKKYGYKEWAYMENLRFLWDLRIPILDFSYTELCRFVNTWKSNFKIRQDIIKDYNYIIVTIHKRFL